ncbi:MAG TPA: lipase family protein [Mycobacteriales bacterium]|jgi:hypothetical protein|nr:lipase family protein [Mycobacteriales bacterium]
MNARRFVAGTALAIAAVIAPGFAPIGASAVTAPQSDAFYKPPAGYAAKAPGTILRSRPVTLAAFAALPQKVQAWQVMFRSTNYAGKPTAAVTTLLRPEDGTPKAVISYQVAEDASAPQCAPSYVMRPAAAPGEAINQAEIAIIDAAVADGFDVSMPDYEGLAGDFGAARQPAYIELDGLRAAEHFAPLGLVGGKATPVALWGYSGGSLASGWGAQLQPRYAPDLNLRGVAVGGFVTNIEQALIKINGGFAAGLVPSALPGILRSTPKLESAIAPYLTAKGKAILAKSGSQCEIANVSQYPFYNVNDYLTVPLAKLLARPAIRRAINGLNLGGTTPKAPLFVYHAINDELIPVAGPDAIVPKYCKAGDSVTYTRDSLSEHAVLAVSGAPAALAWLHARLTGGPVPHGCTTTTVATMALTATAIAQEPEVVTSILTGLAGLPIGPGDF